MRGIFGTKIGVREHRDHYNGVDNKYLAEKEGCKNTVCTQKIAAYTSVMYNGNGWKR